MDEHREWVDARIAEGRINASELHRELEARGVRLSYGTVLRALTKRLGRAGKSRPRANAAKPRPDRPPSPRQLSFDWIRRPEKRTPEAQLRLDKVRSASPDLTAALDLADEFKSLIRKQSSGTLKQWLLRAEASPCSEIRHFAEGIRQDESAVNAAITLAWSNGPVEGHVNRLKIVATDYPDCHSPSLAGYTTGRAVDGVPRAGRLGPPTLDGRTGRMPMPRSYNPQRPSPADDVDPGPTGSTLGHATRTTPPATPTTTWRARRTSPAPHSSDGGRS
jgi:Transposase